MRFFGSLIGIVIGVILIWKTYPLVNTFGKFDWAEQYLAGGLGGTYFFYKLAGMALIVFSALYMFGILDNLLSPLTSIFRGLKGT